MISPPLIESAIDLSRLKRRRHDAMACTWELLLVHESAAYVDQAARAAFDEVDRLERELSRFVQTSDIARINALSPGESLRIGPDALACLAIAFELQAATGGAFDVTVGARVPRRFDRLRPVEPKAAAGGGAIGMSHLRLDRGSRSISISAPLCVDLGAIGKGFAVDRVCELLREWGIAAGLVHCGQSTLAAIGRAPDGRPWPAALRNPGGGDALQRVELTDTTLSGSACVIHGPHIIDPRRVASGVRYLATWAAGATGAITDGFTTAMMTMERHEIAAAIRHWPGMQAWVLEQGEPQPVLSSVERG
jgi:FAD:protein FMN transferase